MTVDADFVVVNHQEQALIFEDGISVPFAQLFGDTDSTENADERVFNYDFRVKQIFEAADGKYS